MLKNKRAKRTNTKIKLEQNIQELWENYQRYNICIIGIPEEEKKEQKGMRRSI